MCSSFFSIVVNCLVNKPFLSNHFWRNLLPFLVAAANAGLKHAVSIKENDLSGGHYEVVAYGDGGHGGYGKAGFSAGSGLKTIAQGSAHQANNAVANQHAAARQAAFVAKSSLAQAAVGVNIFPMNSNSLNNYLI